MQKKKKNLLFQPFLQQLSSRAVVFPSCTESFPSIMEALLALGCWRSGWRSHATLQFSPVTQLPVFSLLISSHSYVGHPRLPKERREGQMC